MEGGEAAPAQEDGGVAAPAAAEDDNKKPFAFQHCKDVSRKDTSAWAVECNICGKQVKCASNACWTYRM